MSHTIQKNTIPFATFALRGGRLRKCGRGVISYAPFLMGTSAIVLGSMFMLSAPSFAQTTNESSKNMCQDLTISTVARTRTNVTSPATIDPPRHTNAAGGQAVTPNDMHNSDEGDDHVNVIETRNGIYNTTFTTTASGTVDVSASEHSTGVSISREGNGALCLVNEANISNALSYGIEASRSGEGVLDISNEGDLTNAGRVGINATRSGDYDLKIKSTGDIGAAKGVRAQHITGEGNIEIRLMGEALIRARGSAATDHGIEAIHSGSGLVDISVLSNRAENSDIKNVESAHGTGIHVKRTRGGRVTVTTDGSVWGKKSGVRVEQDRTGSVKLLVREDSWVHGGEQYGLYVKHSGGGLIEIDVEGSSSNNREGVTSRAGDAIKVINTGDNRTSIDIDGRVSSDYGTSDTRGKGIYAKHDGGGNIDIDLHGDGKILSSDDDGIYAKHESGGNININLRGSGEVVSSDDDGIYAKHESGGNININLQGNGEVSSGADGIYAKHEGGGNIDIDLRGNGEVLSGDDGIYAKSTSSGTVTITLLENSVVSTTTGKYGIDVYHSGSGLVDISVLSNRAENSGTKNVESTHGTGIRVKRGTSDVIGDGNVAVTTGGSVWGEQSGVRVEQNRTGSVTLSVREDSWVHGDEQYGLYVKHSVGGLIEINVEGSSSNNKEGVTSRAGDAVKVINTGDNRTSIEIDGRVSSDYGTSDTRGKGIYTKHGGGGNIDIDLQGDGKILSSDDGIYAKHEGGGNIDIDLKGSGGVSSGDDGIYAKHDSTGNINVNLKERVKLRSTSSIGIHAKHEGTGDVAVEVLGESQVLAEGGDAIHVEGKGLVEIDVKGRTGWHHGVQVRNGNGDAIDAYTNGSEAIDIEIGGLVRTHQFGNAIKADHEGTGNIVINIKSGARVIANHNQSIHAQSDKGINVVIENTGSVRSLEGDGIFALSRDSGMITIDLAGNVFSGSGNDDRAIGMNSGGVKTLILRPGFNMDGDVFSEGAGKGVLELKQRAGSNSEDNRTLNLNKFHGFEEFTKNGEDTWVLNGGRAGNDGPSVFKRAKVTAGTLNFSNVNFAMASGDYRFFEVLPESVLRIVGTNTLKGNLNNAEKGEIVFERGGNLEVKGNYKARGGLVFDIGSGGWQDEPNLLITGDIIGGELLRPVFIRHSESVALGQVDSHWLVLEESDAEWGEDHFDISPEIGGVIIGDGDGVDKTKVVTNAEGVDEVKIGANFYKLTHSYGEVQSGGRTLDANGWYLEYLRSEPVLGVAIFPDPNRGEGENDRRINRNRRETNALRDDALGRVGGVWAEQSSSRTLQESGTISGGHLRTESNRVRFGFDLPAQSFMGGDVVLGAGVWQEFSASEIFSPVGRSTIGVESHAASLRASWWSPTGFYADGQVRYVRFLRGISADNLSRDQVHEGTGTGISTELGYGFTFPFGGMNFEVVPRVQLMWSRVGFGDYASSHSGLVSLEDGELMKGRLGLSWGGEWRDAGGSGRVYGGVNLRDALDGRTAVKATGVLHTNEQGSSVDGRLGLAYEWDDGYSVYGEAKALRSGDVEEVSANLGMSIDF